MLDTIIVGGRPSFSRESPLYILFSSPILCSWEGTHSFCRMESPPQKIQAAGISFLIIPISPVPDFPDSPYSLSLSVGGRALLPRLYAPLLGLLLFLFPSLWACPPGGPERARHLGGRPRFSFLFLLLPLPGIQARLRKHTPSRCGRRLYSRHLLFTR